MEVWQDSHVVSEGKKIFMDLVSSAKKKKSNIYDLFYIFHREKHQYCSVEMTDRKERKKERKKDQWSVHRHKHCTLYTHMQWLTSSKSKDH